MVETVKCSHAQTDAKTWAIIIGINFYYSGSNWHPESSKDSLQNLEGCVDDARRFKSQLEGHLGAKYPSRSKTNTSKYLETILLTSSVPETGPSTEPAPVPDGEMLATYANILSALDSITDRARSGDSAIFFFSGHGLRASSLVAEQGWAEKPKDSYDESIMPCDAFIPSQEDRPGGALIRDFELNYYFTRITTKGVKLTVILDSCHSGGASRDVLNDELAKDGLKAKAQPLPKATSKDFSDYVDWRTYCCRSPLASKVIPMKEAWNDLMARVHGSRSASGSYLLKPLGYNLLAACLPHELSYEQHGHGKFATAIADSLEETSRPVTLRELYYNIFDRVYIIGKQNLFQTPLLLGDLDQTLFGDKIEKSQKVFGIPLHAVPYPTQDEPNAMRRLILRSGLAHGIKKGSIYTVRLWDDVSMHEQDPQTRVWVGRVQAITSEVYVVQPFERMEEFSTRAEKFQHKFRERYNAWKETYLRISNADIQPHPWPTGCHAILTEGPASEAKRVYLRASKTKKLKAGYYVQGPVPLEIVHYMPDSKDGKEVYVIDNAAVEEGYTLQSSDSDLLGHISPLITEEEDVLRHIMQISQYLSKAGISQPIKERKFSDHVEVGHGWYDFTITRVKDSSNNYKVVFEFKIEAIGQVGKEYLNLVFFHFTPNWGIRRIFPYEGAFETIYLHENRHLEFYFQSETITGAPKGTDFIKLMMFTASTSFQAWETPDITATVRNSDISQVAHLRILNQNPGSEAPKTVECASRGKDAEEQRQHCEWWTARRDMKDVALEE